MDESIDLIGTFTGPEMEAGTGLPNRTVEILKRDGLMLGQVTEQTRGKSARFAFKALSRLSAISTLSKSLDGGFVTAARIINEIAPALEARYGSVPFGFWDMQHALLDKGHSGRLLRGSDGEFCPYRTLEAAWRAGLEDERKKRPNDYHLVIIDGAHVGATTPQFVHQVEPVLTYRSFGRSGGIKVELIDSEAGAQVFASKLANAESDLRLNLGLALRRAVVQIIKAREAIHGPRAS